MAGRTPRRGPRSGRPRAPRVEGLEARELLSAGALGPPLGRYILPGVLPPSAALALRPPLSVDPHRAINRELASVMGPGLANMELQLQLDNPTSSTNLSSRILAQPTIHALLGDNDTYTLLNSPTIAQILSPQLLQASTQGIVTLTLPSRDLAQLGNPSLILVQPGDPAPGGGQFAAGFQVEVPSVDVVINPNQTITVQVPVSQIPASAQLTTSAQADLNAIYQQTGPSLIQALQTGLSLGSPPALTTVPGLRLVNALEHGRAPIGAGLGPFERTLRIAAEQGLVTNLNAQQQAQVTQGLNTFLNVVTNWDSGATAQRDQFLAGRSPGQLLPPMPRGPLNRTIAVTVGTIQPNSPGLPERIDVGFVLDRQGDYGLILGARGPLSTSVTNTAPTGVVAGDLQVEASNAPSLGQLSGWRVVEGVTEGNVVSGALATTNAGGVTTFAASAGYGSGLEYGLGIRYTTVIPLGNVNTA